MGASQSLFIFRFPETRVFFAVIIIVSRLLQIFLLTSACKLGFVNYQNRAAVYSLMFQLLLTSVLQMEIFFIFVNHFVFM